MDSEIKGYIFDYGGTLDTGGQHWARVIWKAWQGHGMPVSEQQFREAYVFAERTLDRSPIVLPTYTFKKLLDVKLRLQMEYLFTHRWWTADKKEFTRVHLAILEDLYADVRRHVAQSRLVLNELRERCPLVLVSNFYGNMGSVLFEMELDGLFSRVVESTAVGIRKPDPRLFQLAIDAFGQAEAAAPSPSEIMVVGDSRRNDIAPARSLGCQTTWLKGEGWRDEPSDESLPTHVITELQQLLKL